MNRGPRTAAIVLAAGAGSRFGGDKLLAPLGGRPVLRWVLDALARAGVTDRLVVIPAGAPELEAVAAAAGAGSVENPEPARGLASSLQVGWQAIRSTSSPPDLVIVALGDQPLVAPDVVTALVSAPLDGARPVIVARHADGARNPVRLEAEADEFVAATTGDRGLGPLLDAHPERVRWIEVAATNPDVDRPDDLTTLLLRRWADRVRENAAQVDRFREVSDGRDFYATVSRTFVADPARRDDPVLDDLLRDARPTDTWLDIGAGAGRYALPLAGVVREVVAIDPSASMLSALRASMRPHEIVNVRLVEGRWPPDAATRAVLGSDPVADVSMLAHVGYDIEAIGPFLEAMEAASGRECIAVLMSESPASAAAPFWPLVHGEPRVELPALPDLVEILASRGRQVSVRRLMAERRRWTDLDELLAFLRRQLWTRPGSPADARLLAAMTAAADAGPEGVAIPGTPTMEIGVIRWSPHEIR